MDQSDSKYDYYKKYIDSTTKELFIFLLFFIAGCSFFGYAIQTGVEYQSYEQKVQSYQKSLNTILQCRQDISSKSFEKIEQICGKIPEWSDFSK